MRKRLLLAAIFATAFSAPVQAEPLFGIPALLLKRPVTARKAQTPESSVMQILSGASADRYGPRSVVDQGEPAAQALLAMGPRFMPVEFQVEALAGHRGFATQSVRHGRGNRMAIDVSNNDLGVGTTFSYDARVADGWLASPFVSVDYNRIDTTSVINAHSPYAYARNNGDTGLTGSAGATLSHEVASVRGLSILGYGALTAGSSRAAAPDDATMGTRVVKALAVSGVETVGYELGAGTRFVVSDRLRIDGGFVQASRATAAVLALHGEF